MATITRWASPGKSLTFDNLPASLAYADSIGYALDVEPIAPAPVVVYTKMTKRAFTGRFPKNADGVSTKYSLIELFLQDDGYAASLGVNGAALYGLRALIITGTGTLDRSPHVDLQVPDAANFTMLLVQPNIPAAFRLSAAERTAILTAPITEAEAFKG